MKDMLQLVIVWLLTVTAAVAFSVQFPYEDADSEDNSLLAAVNKRRFYARSSACSCCSATQDFRCCGECPQMPYYSGYILGKRSIEPVEEERDINDIDAQSESKRSYIDCKCCSLTGNRTCCRRCQNITPFFYNTYKKRFSFFNRESSDPCSECQSTYNPKSCILCNSLIMGRK
ncbi:unnamed protein product [Owenia fusiformis]|uniref:Uncharacterized protein n=1 Tax=Owenia fusiformis TaxID=6347 RepID=A0A8J1TWI8_OWEFU|nr:unnamed protein product [Owenia fusiformis]